MRLSNVNKVLSEAVQLLSELAIGQTFENAGLRIHRFAGSIRVTDLTNAGKRGKMVDEFALYDIDNIKDKRLARLIETFAKKLPWVWSYKKALAMANGIVKEAQNMKVAGWEYPEVATSTYKGVRVAPGGFKPVQIDSGDIALHSDSGSFRVTDRTDHHNEPTIVSPMRGQRTAVKEFYKWATENADRIKKMTFLQVKKELDKRKIGYHYYMAMD